MFLPSTIFTVDDTETSWIQMLLLRQKSVVVPLCWVNWKVLFRALALALPLLHHHSVHRKVSSLAMGPHSRMWQTPWIKSNHIPPAVTVATELSSFATDSKTKLSFTSLSPPYLTHWHFQFKLSIHRLPSRTRFSSDVSFFSPLEYPIFAKEVSERTEGQMLLINWHGEPEKREYWF